MNYFIKEMSLVLVNSVDEFDALKKGTLPLLIDFFAEWCGPCRMLSPVIEELAKDLNGKVCVAKINIDELPYLSESMGIRSIPTMLIFLDSKEVDRKMGFLSGVQIKDWLKSLSII